MRVAFLGAQFGDEGKGKVVDYYANQANMIVRFQGGANAGHTIYKDGVKYVFHSLPVGALHGHTVNVIGPGCAIDIIALREEIIQARMLGLGIYPSNLSISPRATIVLPMYISRDIEEEDKNQNRIGTTRKGIGPTYEARAARTAFQMVEILNPLKLFAKYRELAAEIFAHDDDEASLKRDVFNKKNELIEACEFLWGFLQDVGTLITTAVEDDSVVLYEGAQGALLDNQHGDYPFVTSSNTVSSAVCLGAGVPPYCLDTSIGIAKAYITRVGKGPFPTLMGEDVHEVIQEAGGEWGATTGRPRKCGWLDLVALKYAVKINDFEGLVVTKVDVLDTLDEIRVCTEYSNPTSDLVGLKKVKSIEMGYPLLTEGLLPVYKTFPGWLSPTRGLQDIRNLPLKLREYLEFIESFVEVPIVGISTGPERSSFIERRALFSPFPLVTQLERCTADLASRDNFSKELL